MTLSWAADAYKEWGDPRRQPDPAGGAGPGEAPEYSELYKRLEATPYDQYPGRPGWTPVLPNDRFADPSDARPVSVPF